MVTERDFNSVFDYRSAFEYGPADINMKKPYNRNNYKSAFTYQAVSIPEDEDREENTKEALPFRLLRNVITSALYFITILSFPISFWICVKKVSSLERIVLMRLGKLQPIKGPGYALVLPLVDKWTRVDLRHQNFTVSTPQLITADGGIIEAQTDIEYRVSNVLDYILKLRQQDSSLKELGVACLTNILSEKDQEDLETKRDVISSNLKDELNDSAAKWGLEVVNVSLHSIRVLKAPEPSNALDKVLTAIKSVTGGNENSSPMFPHLSSLAGEPAGIPSTKQTPPTKPGNEENEDCVEVIKKLAEVAVREGCAQDVKASFRLEVIGRSTRILLLVFDRGNISVLENADTGLQTDVQVILTEDNLRDFLSGQMSPLEAYMEGKVMVTGDWSLLRSLSKVFKSCVTK